MKKCEFDIQQRWSRPQPRRTVGYWLRGIVGVLVILFVGWWMIASIATALW